MSVLSSELGPTPPSPQASVSPHLRFGGWRNTRLRVRGGGPNSDDGEKPSPLSTLWPTSMVRRNPGPSERLASKIETVHWFMNQLLKYCTVFRLRIPLSYTDPVWIPNTLVSGFGCRIRIRPKLPPKKEKMKKVRS